ncbi:murein biosynthesis integral membrane protein MurJ [Patescibacteria group bacterium]|nr:murein biosynthesis integral membrane protein MurJ [Patescibacteria group bacterium]
MLKKIFRPQTTGLAALILTIASLLSYAMGMVRDIVMAGYYGAQMSTDAYNSAFLVPDGIFNLFVAGALTAAFIPVFSGYLTKKQKDEASSLASTFLASASLVVVVVGAIAYIFMPDIIGWYFNEASADKIELIIKMSRILLLSPLLFAISNTLGNILISHKQFVSYAIAPLFYNVGIIGGIVFFSESMGIYAAAWGAVFGIGLHLLTRLVEILTLDFKFTWNINFWHPGIKKIVALMIPKTVGLMSWQFALWKINQIGNSKEMVDGSVAAFYYARNLQSFPVSIFGIALATAVFPYLADHAAAGRGEVFAHQYQKSLRQILFFTLPAAAGIFLLSKPIVKLIYMRGAFDENDLIMTSGILAFFAISIPFEGAVHLTARAFYAHKNTIIPVFGAVILMLSTVLGAQFYAAEIGPKAFSLFFTIGSVLQIGFLVLLLRKKLSSFNLGDFMLNLFKMILAVTLMGASIYGLSFVDLPIRLLVIIQISIGAVVYFAAAYLLKCEELKEANKIFSRVFKKFTPNNPLKDEQK